jgi:hypothetical protein
VRLRKILCSGLPLLLLAGALSGCSATYETRGIESCSPEYSISHPEGGTISIRQPGPGQAIAYGVYTVDKYKASHFFVKVYAGGVRVDTKNQYYEPHGSVNAQRAAKYSGQVFELQGTITHDDDMLNFDVKCRIA